MNTATKPDDLPAAAAGRKWSLTREALDLLLGCLAEDRDAAGQKYQEIRRNLIRFFEWRGCPFPEDHADETVNRVARKVSEGEEILNPAAYFMGVARFLAMEIAKARAKESEALSEMAATPAQTEDSTDTEARLGCLRVCLASLSDDNRHLILQYYQGEKGKKIDNRKKLTERLGISVNTLRMRALRLRERLQQCVESCLDEDPKMLAGT